MKGYADEPNPFGNLPCDFEYIQRENDIEIGISFRINRGKSDCAYDGIATINICQYEGNRILNSRFFLEPEIVNAGTKDECLSEYYYDKNWYYFDDDLLHKIEHVDFHPAYRFKQDFFNNEKVQFIHDEEGCPTHFVFDGDYEFVNPITENNKIYYRREFL